jgi:hypothetical protein
MASITMMFFLLDARGPSDWRDRVLEKLDFEQGHAQWFADLENSAVGNRTIPRVGGILDLTNASDANIDPINRQHKLETLIEVILRENLPVPLYFFWGKIKDVPDYPIPRRLKETGFYPDWQEIRHLRDLPGETAFSPWHEKAGRMYSEREHRPPAPPAPPVASSRDMTSVLPFVATPVLPVVSPSDATPPRPPSSTDTGSTDGGPAFPQPEKHSGQLYGEDINSFLSRRQARNAELAAAETDKMKAERLQREAHAAKGAPPGRKGARVFIWEEETGFYIRRSINRNSAADMWDHFTDNQRLYDGFRNEWDLCEALAPSEGVQDDYDSDDGAQMDADAESRSHPHPENDLSGAPAELYPEEQIGPLLTSDDIMQSHGLERDVEPGEIPDAAPPPYEPYCDISEIPHARFGFTRPIGPESYPMFLDKKLCLKSLGDENWPKMGQAQFEHLPSLLASIHAARSLNDVPQQLLDLRQPGADISAETNWAVAVTPERLNNKLFYVLRPKGVYPEDCRIHILLESAATTLQVLRMGWGPDLQEIIFNLVQLGVEFRICIRDRPSIVPRPPLADGYTGLGCRRVGHKPTHLDFNIYRDLCWEFFLSPRGRAALFAGGIIGRLAREIVPEALACLGPTSEVPPTGVCLWDGHSSMAYWDDTLTSQEIDLICGVYAIPTGVF